MYIIHIYIYTYMSFFSILLVLSSLYWNSGCDLLGTQLRLPRCCPFILVWELIGANRPAELSKILPGWAGRGKHLADSSTNVRIKSLQSKQAWQGFDVPHTAEFEVFGHAGRLYMNAAVPLHILVCLKAAPGKNLSFSRRNWPPIGAKDCQNNFCLKNHIDLSCQKRAFIVF